MCVQLVLDWLSSLEVLFWDLPDEALSVVLIITFCWLWAVSRSNYEWFKLLLCTSRFVLSGALSGACLLGQFVNSLSHFSWVLFIKVIVYSFIHGCYQRWLFGGWRLWMEWWDVCDHGYIGSEDLLIVAMPTHNTYSVVASLCRLERFKLHY